MTALQVARAIAFAHPESSPAKRYLSLVQHNSYWFGKIIDRGYETTVPPIDHKEMEVSNVAFFPAYPLLGGLVKRATGLGTHLIIANRRPGRGVGILDVLSFFFANVWRLSLLLQVFGAMAIAVHPAAVYLVAGYSESLFLMALTGFIYWSTGEGRAGHIQAVLHGCIASAMRIGLTEKN